MTDFIWDMSEYVEVETIAVLAAEYGVTEFVDVSAALSDGKVILVKDGDTEYVSFTVSRSGSTITMSALVDDTTVRVFTVDDTDTWAYTDTTLATSSDLSGKQDVLTFDDTPTEDSTNPVKSGGVYTSLSGKQNTLVSGTNIKTVDGTSVVGSGNIETLRGYPQKAIADVMWNCEIQLDVLAANQSITLPALPDVISGEIRLTAKQSSGNSYTVTLIAPTGVTITDGNNSGSSLVITPTAEKYIEISAAVVEDIISVITYEV